MKWQERYARWMLRAKWPKKLSARLDPYVMHWWFLMILGLIIFGVILYATIPLDPPTSEVAFENPSEFWQSIAMYQMKLFLLLFGFFALLQFSIAGLITEERKGYQMIIERLEAENEALKNKNREQ